MNSTISLLYIYGEWLPMSLEKCFISAVLWPLLALLAVPLWIVFYVYLSVAIVLVYEMSSKAKEEAQRSYYFILGHLWDFFGRIWHGKECLLFWVCLFWEKGPILMFIFSTRHFINSLKYEYWDCSSDNSALSSVIYIYLYLNIKFK